MTVGTDDVVAWIRAVAGEISARKEELTALDSAIGDADHGINMDRGMQAVLAKLDGTAAEDIGALLKTVGMTLVSTVGGAGGPLYGTLFLQLGAATAGKTEITLEDWTAALRAAVQGVQARGKAEPQDKTMVDALLPAVEALDKAVADGASFADGLRRSADAAQRGHAAPRSRSSPARGARAIWGNAAPGTRIPAPRPPHCCSNTAADTWGGADD